MSVLDMQIQSKDYANSIPIEMQIRYITNLYANDNTIRQFNYSFQFFNFFLRKGPDGLSRTYHDNNMGLEFGLFEHYRQKLNWYNRHR